MAALIGRRDNLEKALGRTWLFERVDMTLRTASVFFWSNMLAAFSYPVAARLATRSGLEHPRFPL